MDNVASTSPLTASQVAGMLARLPQPTPRRAAALHLALPTHVAAPIAVRVTERSWSYRGVTVTWSDDVAADAAALAAAGHEAGDRYLDPSGEVTEWVKVIRSGTRKVAFGADTLLSAPLLTLEATTPDGLAGELLRQWRDGRLTATGPGVVSTSRGEFLLEGDERGWVVRPADAGAEQGSLPSGDLDVVGTGNELAEELGADSWTSETVGSAGPGLLDLYYTLMVADREMVVPVTLGPSSEIVGVASSVYTVGEDEEEVPLPEGFTFLGRTLDGGEVVARHQASGTTVVVLV